MLEGWLKGGEGKKEENTCTANEGKIGKFWEKKISKNGKDKVEADENVVNSPVECYFPNANIIWRNTDYSRVHIFRKHGVHTALSSRAQRNTEQTLCEESLKRYFISSANSCGAVIWGRGLSLPGRVSYRGDTAAQAGWAAEEAGRGCSPQRFALCSLSSPSRCCQEGPAERDRLSASQQPSPGSLWFTFWAGEKLQPSQGSLDPPTLPCHLLLATFPGPAPAEACQRALCGFSASLPGNAAIQLGEKEKTLPIPVNDAILEEEKACCHRRLLAIRGRWGVNGHLSFALTLLGLIYVIKFRRLLSDKP